MTNIAMTGIIHSPNTGARFHNGGYTIVMKNIMETFSGKKIDIITEKDDWDEYGVIIINEGGNYSEGVFNVFGGVQEKHIIKLKKLCNFKGKLFCLKTPIDYNAFVNKRKELKDFNFKVPIINTLLIDDIFNKLVLGDSHSIAVYKSGYGLSKNDSKTLNGFLTIGLKNYIPDNISHLIFYAGNIDIRFHIHRFGGFSAIRDLLKRLEDQCLELSVQRGIDITLTEVIPIEDESRILPKTGQYKEKNFYGTKNERSQYVFSFNRGLQDICLNNGWKLLKWNLGDELLFEDMEQRQSVHLRPSSYMFYNEIKN